MLVDTAGALDERKTSTLLRSDGVDHHCAASAQWFLCTDGGITRCLMLNFGV